MIVKPWLDVSRYRFFFASPRGVIFRSISQWSPCFYKKVIMIAWRSKTKNAPHGLTCLKNQLKPNLICMNRGFSAAAR